MKAGEYVAWWSLMAVFVYYYEVIARFVFNSPTNWVHESMFLMFGMQYMLSGAYAYREDQHVRVDVIYAKFSPRGKAIADIITSVFFFIFIGTMLVTGYRFAGDAVNFGEHSFTEWGIQYWPVKLDDTDRRRAAAAAGDLEADQGHSVHFAQGSVRHGHRDRHRMALPAAVRLAGPSAHAGTADGVLHRQPCDDLSLRVRQQRGAEHDAVADLSVHDGLPALRGPAVHLHGGGAGKGRHHRGAVRRHLQMAGIGQGRIGIRDGRGMHAARGDGRRRGCHRSHDGDDRAARDAAPQLRAQARVRIAAGGRNARHPDPAVGDGDRLRSRRAAVARRASDRLGLSGAAAFRALHRVRDDSLLHQSRRSAPRCLSKSASTCAKSCACCATRSRRCC